MDDFHEVRAGRSHLLDAAGYQVRAFDSAESFLDDQDCESPGCLLLDSRMPGLNGLELQRLLVGLPSARPFVFLSGQGDIYTAVQALKAGAVNFLAKPIDPDRLFAAVELEQAFRQDVVMHHITQGRLNKQFAADLGAGEKTSKLHRARLMKKMSVRSVAELVRLCSRVGIAVEPVLGREADYHCRMWTVQG